MAMVDVDSDSPSRLVWSEGRRLVGSTLHSSDEPGELSQWFCHDDSTINIGICIIIIIIVKMSAAVAKHIRCFITVTHITYHL